MIRTTLVTLAFVAGTLALPAPPTAGAGEGNPGAGYVVREGQTLSVIAHDVLGDPRLWPAIYWANRDQIKDPTILHVGQTLAIPVVSQELAERDRIRRQAADFAATTGEPEGPDVAAAPPNRTPSSSTE